jgi:CRISPR type II-A-associated protein Csn2
MQPLEIEENKLTSLLVEDSRIFREIVSMLYYAQQGQEDSVFLSNNEKSLNFTKEVDLIQQFVPFTLNTKTLISAATKIINKNALSRAFMNETETVISQVNHYLRQLLLMFPFEMDYENLSPETLIKGAVITFSEDELSPTNRILQYLRMTRELIGEKLYIFINLRAYFATSELDELFSIVNLEKYRILLIDNVAHPLLSTECRTILDCDACEIKSGETFLS